MADDTRQTPSSSTEPKPTPRAPANIMPGGTAHTAGGEKTSDAPTYIDAVKTLGPDYYLNFHKRPCVRDSQLQGIAAGFAGGALAAVIGKPVLIASNWAVASWCGVSVISYQVCQYYRSREKDGMRQAQELMEQKRLAFEANREAKRLEREKERRVAEELRVEEERRRNSWGAWVGRGRFW